jgi:hypothetical protein
MEGEVMSAAMAAEQCRFVRRTTLNLGEYRINFRQIDCEVIEVLTSPEADQVTSQMSKIYLRLTNAPQDYWEREGVLRFVGAEREEQWRTAWEQLVSLAGVASATARKALAWMAQQGIIGYFAGKNGVGIRIFINRAASSIRLRPEQPQKNLRLIRASTREPPTSTVEAAFKESHADKENLDLDFIPRAPEGGAPDIPTDQESSEPNSIRSAPPLTNPPAIFSRAPLVEEIVAKVIPQVKSVAAQQHEQTREWFINQALPKAIRVAQRLAYDVLRTHGVIKNPRSRNGSEREYRDDRSLGKPVPAKVTQRLLSDEEITEWAETCVALLVAQGQTIERTLCEMGVEAGGFLLPEDVPKVRARAEDLTRVGATTPNDGREGDGS